VAGYNADINVRVNGAKELNKLTQSLEATEARIKSINKLRTAPDAGGDFLSGNKAGKAIKAQVMSLNALNSNLAKAADNFRKVDLENGQASIVAKQYAQALDQVNVGLEKRNRLLNEAQKKLAFERFAKGDVSGRQQYSSPAGPKQARGGGRGGMGRGRENLMLGAGFPLLFGGGVGSVGGGVGGALLGNAMGMEGFGAQILGSAIGAMMDTAVQKAAKLGESLRTLNMDDLVESGVRLSGELQNQVTQLTRIGQQEQARALLATQVMNQTGASAGVLGDINNITNILKATWNDLVGSVGAFLGVISGPLITALAGVLKIVTEIIKLFNRGISTIRDGFRSLGEKFAPKLVEAIDKAMEKLNIGLQAAIAKAETLARTFDLNADTLLTKRLLEDEKTSGSTFAGQRVNARVDRDKKLLDLRSSRTKELQDLYEDDPKLAENETFKKAFKGQTRQMQLGIEDEYAKKIQDINDKEQDTISKLQGQIQLKQTLLGIDEKIGQAVLDDDKQLQFRLEAEKERAKIMTTAAEKAEKAKGEKAKALLLDEAEVDLKRVEYELAQKIRELDKEKQAEAEGVITKLQNENALIEARLNGTENEVKGQILIEQLTDKIGENYREQITALVEKNVQLTEEENNVKKIDQQWKQIKDTIAGGLTNAIMGLIDGTKTLSESLAGILKQIGQILINKALTSWIGGLKFGGGGVTTGSVSDLAPVAVAAEGAYWKNGIKGFSTGGLVTRPTIGLIGEAGEDEYIIPASKMSGAMERYSAGARGQAVIPGGGTVASGSGVSSSPTVVNYTGPVLSFNSEAYVPKSAIPEIINSAARRGAQEGQSKVFSQLKNSRSQRSRVGL